MIFNVSERRTYASMGEGRCAFFKMFFRLHITFTYAPRHNWSCRPNRGDISYSELILLLVGPPNRVYFHWRFFCMSACTTTQLFMLTKLQRWFSSWSYNSSHMARVIRVFSLGENVYALSCGLSPRYTCIFSDVFSFGEYVYVYIPSRLISLTNLRRRFTSWAPGLQIFSKWVLRWASTIMHALRHDWSCRRNRSTVFRP